MKLSRLFQPSQSSGLALALSTSPRAPPKTSPRPPGAAQAKGRELKQETRRGSDRAKSSALA